MLEPDVRRLLGTTAVAHLATVLPDGSPHSVPVFVGAEGDRIAFFTGPTSVKARNLRRDPRVSLTALDEADWLTHVSLQGRVTELVDDQDLSGIDRLARHYTDREYPDRDSKRVNAWIEIDTWHAWGDAARV